MMTYWHTSNVATGTSINNCLCVHYCASSIIHNQNSLLQLSYPFFVKHPSETQTIISDVSFMITMNKIN